MKRILATVSLGLLLCGCGILNYNSAVGKYSKYIDGYWGQWESFMSYTSGAFQGGPNSFTVYKSSNHPSNFCFRITFFGFDKNSIKKNSWETFSGTIEYYVYYPKDYKLDSKRFVNSTLGFLDGKAIGSEELVKRPATIKMQKVNGGYLYNVFFDEVGFAIVIPWSSAR